MNKLGRKRLWEALAYWKATAQNDPLRLPLIAAVGLAVAPGPLQHPGLGSWTLTPTANRTTGFCVFGTSVFPRKVVIKQMIALIFFTSNIHSVYRAHAMVSPRRHGLQEANAVCTSIHHPLLTKVWQRRDGWVSMSLRGELSLYPSTHVKSRCVNTCLWSQNQENKDKRTPRLAGQLV